MNRFGRTLTVVFASLAAAVCAIGQTNSPPATLWQPPALRWPPSVHATVAKPMITEIRIGDVAVQLEKTELAAMQQRFGGVLGNRGDAGDALGWLCLTGKDAAGTYALWLLSGEIDGPTVGALRIQTIPSGAPIDRRCSALPAGTTMEMQPARLHLGMTRSAALQLLGPPSRELGRSAFYYHEHDLNIRNEPYTYSNSVIVEYREGVVAGIDVWQSTVN